jgi:hypothetical protein
VNILLPRKGRYCIDICDHGISLWYQIDIDIDVNVGTFNSRPNFGQS